MMKVKALVLIVLIKSSLNAWGTPTPLDETGHVIMVNAPATVAVGTQVGRPTNGAVQLHIDSPTVDQNGNINYGGSQQEPQAQPQAQEQNSPTTSNCSPDNRKELLEKRDGLAHPEDESGSEEFRKCYSLSRGKLREFYTYGSKRKIDWDGILGNCKDDATIKKMAERCDAAAYIIANATDDGWNTDSDFKVVKSSDGEMKCISSGIETVDYAPCVDFIKDNDLLEAGQQTMQKGQEIYYQEKSMSAQADASKNIDTKSALKLTHDSLKTQQNLVNQRAAMDTVKLTALISKYKKIPDLDDVGEICKQYNDTISGVNKEVCKSVARSKFEFYQNQNVKDKMKQRLVQIGLQLGTNIATASLLSKRASSVTNIMAKVDSFKPIDPMAPTDNVQTTYCRQNPGDPKCLTGGLERTFDAMGDNVISFGDGGSGVTFNNTNPYTDPSSNSGSASSSGATTQKNVGPAGNIVKSAQVSGGLETTAAAAALGKGSAPAGGGGGGGSGGGSGGGGGGGGAPAGQGQGGVSAAIAGKTPNYGGGSGTLSMMGGLGINKSKSTAKDDGNPFGKLFNKEGNKNGTLNFGRDPASQKVGDKGDNIFDMISKRYSSVNTDKRLLEYELAK